MTQLLNKALSLLKWWVRSFWPLVSSLLLTKSNGDNGSSFRPVTFPTPSLPWWGQNTEWYSGHKLGFLCLALSLQSASPLMQQFPFTHNALEEVKPSVSGHPRQAAGIRSQLGRPHLKSLVMLTCYSSLANAQAVVTCWSLVSEQQGIQVNLAVTDWLLSRIPLKTIRILSGKLTNKIIIFLTVDMMSFIFTASQKLADWE